jgi:membrane protein
MIVIKRIYESLVYYLKYLNKAADQHHILLLGSGLSFSVFTCIIPLILIIFAILGKLLSLPQIEKEVSLYIDRVIPYADEAAFVKQLVVERAEEFKVFRNIAGFLGIIGMIFMSSGLFGSIRTILNRVYHVTSRPPAWRGKLKDLGLMLLVLVYFLISITILPTSEAVLSFATNWEVLSFLRVDTVTNILFALLSLLVAFVSFFVIYWLIPQRRLALKVVLISSLVAAGLWQIANQLFGVYIEHMFTLKNVYGAYSLIVVVAIWIYYTSVIFIIGATMGQAYREKVGKCR